MGGVGGGGRGVVDKTGALLVMVGVVVVYLRVRSGVEGGRG